MNDEELQELFSAFDDVSASDTLQSSTLDFIMGAAAAAPAESTADAEPVEEQSHTVAARRGGKARIRSSWRAMRVAAVAACLALALTGGAAYAYPASTVLVTQGDTTIELHVNVFGQVLSASASDDETQSLIDELGLLHTPYADSVSRVSHSLQESNPAVPVEVVLNGVTQAVDPVDEALQATEGANSTESAPLKSNDNAVLKTELPKADSEPAATAEPSASASVATYVPEPSGITVGDNDSAKSDSGKRSSDRAADQPESSAPISDSDSSGSGSSDEAVAPVQPVIVDEDTDEGQDVQPVDEVSSNTGASSQDDEEVVYDTERPPKSHN